MTHIKIIAAGKDRNLFVWMLLLA